MENEKKPTEEELQKMYLNTSLYTLNFGFSKNNLKDTTSIIFFCSVLTSFKDKRK